jgi:hypothetical protein
MEATSSSAHSRLPVRTRASRWLSPLILFLISIALFMLSAILFSTSLWIGKSLESAAIHDRGPLLRANDRYWHFFPAQLLAIALVAFIVTMSLPLPGSGSRISPFFRRALILAGAVIGLLPLNYVVGILLFQNWGFAVARWLER